LFLVAFLYASVGHGGASGYLALMAIFSFAPEVMKPTALLLNVFVSIISFIQFYRGSYFHWKIFLPLALASVPMAFVGGFIEMDATIYKKVLALLLLIPIGRILFTSPTQVGELKPANNYIALFIGGAIGLISGMVGIGGGIILTPILLILKWTDLKQAAAVSALFIFVNSIAGLAGQFSIGIHLNSEMYLYVLIALVGGWCGAYFGAMKFNQTILKYLLASALLIAVIKLIFMSA
jgi:uncharacterized membrane protein YfcA